MKRVKNYLLGSAVIVVAALVLSLVADIRRAVADEFKDVRIINTESVPANVRDVDTPRRTPVQIKVNTFINFGEIVGEADIYTVPMGRRLVIEHAALESETVNAGNGIRATLSSRFAGESFIHPLDIRAQTANGLGGPLFVANHPLLAFVDPRQVLTVTAEVNEPKDGGLGFYNALTGTLSGYLEEVSP